MKKMGFSSCLADPDLWMRKVVSDSGEQYYEYVLLSVDNCLAISQHPCEILTKIDYHFPLKPGSVGPPNLYLGAKLSKIQLPNDVEAWSAGTSQYIQKAVENVETHLEQASMK